MPYATIPTVVTGDIIPASYGNTYLKGNLDYFKGLLDGTGGAVAVTVPNVLRVQNDAQAELGVAGGNPYYNYDSGDYHEFVRASDIWRVAIANNIVLSLDANGKITGTGFYDSGEVSVLNGATTAFNHGLSARPRFVFAFANTVTGTANSKTLLVTPWGVGGTPPQLTITSVSSTQVAITNTAGATRFFNLYAIV